MIKGLRKQFLVNAIVLVSMLCLGLLFPGLLGFEQLLIDEIRSKVLNLPWYGLNCIFS